MSRSSADEPQIRLALTPRQREVLELMARGWTNAEIADHLGVTLDGAKWHVREILAKLDVESREQAAAVWRSRRGLPTRLGSMLRRISGVVSLWWVRGSLVAAAVAGTGLAGISIRDAVVRDNPTDATPIPTATPHSQRTTGLGTPVADAAAVLDHGLPIPFAECSIATNWARPTLVDMRAKAFTNPLYGDGVRPRPSLYALYLSPFQYISRPMASDSLTALAAFSGIRSRDPGSASSSTCPEPGDGSIYGVDEQRFWAADYRVAEMRKLDGQLVIRVEPEPGIFEVVAFSNGRTGDVPKSFELVQVVDRDRKVIAEKAPDPADWNLGRAGEFDSAWLGSRSQAFPLVVHDTPLSIAVFEDNPQERGELVVLDKNDVVLRRVALAARASLWEPAAHATLPPGTYQIVLTGQAPNTSVLIVRDGVPLP